MYLKWFSLYALLHNLLYHDSLYCDNASSPNKLFDHFLFVHRQCWMFCLFCSKVLTREKLDTNRILEYSSRRFTRGNFLCFHIGKLKYVLHLNFFKLVLLDVVGNKSYRNLFIVPYWEILVLDQKVTPSQARGVTNDYGPIFFSNNHKRGYYKVSNFSR